MLKMNVVVPRWISDPRVPMQHNFPSVLLSLTLPPEVPSLIGTDSLPALSLGNTTTAVATPLPVGVAAVIVAVLFPTPGNAEGARYTPFELMLPGPVKVHVTVEAPGTENVCELPSATFAELGLTLSVGVGVGGGVLLPPPQATIPIRTKQMRSAESILVITKLHPVWKRKFPFSIGRVAVKYRILRDVHLVIWSRRPKVIRIVKEFWTRDPVGKKERTSGSNPELKARTNSQRNYQNHQKLKGLTKIAGNCQNCQIEQPKPDYLLKEAPKL